MIQHNELTRYAEQFALLSFQPLRITMVLKRGQRLAGYDPLNLDNLLARAVVDVATGWRGLPNSDEPYELPTPLQCLWRDNHGLPLWATTVFRPLGIMAHDVSYWHKRQQTGRWTGTKSGRFNISPTDGRWMERRVPLPTTIAECWAAECVGNANVIGDLLEQMSFAGKRRSCGFGEVEHWHIEPIEAFSLLDDSGCLLRPIPQNAAEVLDGRMPQAPTELLGWTPPQWKRALWSPGWRTGTTVGDIDWFAGVDHV